MKRFFLSFLLFFAINSYSQDWIVVTNSTTRNLTFHLIAYGTNPGYDTCESWAYRIITINGTNSLPTFNPYSTFDEYPNVMWNTADGVMSGTDLQNLYGNPSWGGIRFSFSGTRQASGVLLNHHTCAGGYSPNFLQGGITGVLTINGNDTYISFTD